MTQKVKTILRRKSNSEVESGYQKTEKVIKAKLLSNHERRINYRSKADRIARDFECQNKWIFKNAAKYFPDEPWMRTVDKYYPNAEGGALLIDEPELPHDIKRCERKQIVLEAMGYRYLIIKPEMTDIDCFTELEACGQRLKKQSTI